MTIKDLSSAQVSALVGTRDGRSGVLYPAAGLQPWHEWLVRTLDALDADAPGLRVAADDGSDTAVYITAGVAGVGGDLLSYAGGTIELSAYDDDTAYVWLYSNAGVATIGKSTDAAGWPTTEHLKLAEVTLAGGAITGIVDRRLSALLSGAAGGVGGGAALRFTPAIETQGSTSGASRIHIQATDLEGRAITGVCYLRLRVCDEDDYADATDATIAAAGASSVVETLSATKDLVLASSAVGLFEIDLTDATAETLTLRMGPAPLGAALADYRAALDVTHSA